MIEKRIKELIKDWIREKLENEKKFQDSEFSRGIRYAYIQLLIELETDSDFNNIQRVETKQLLEEKNRMIKFFNDTNKPMTVRINIADCLPTVKQVKPQKTIAVFTRSSEVFVKVWEDNVILFQDIGIVADKKREKE